MVCLRCNGFYIVKGMVFRMIDVICIGIKIKVKIVDIIMVSDYGYIECVLW